MREYIVNDKEAEDIMVYDYYNSADKKQSQIYQDCLLKIKTT